MAAVSLLLPPWRHVKTLYSSSILHQRVSGTIWYPHFPRVHQGSLSSSKARSFESISLPFLLVGWQVSGGIFRLGLSALFSAGPCGSSSSLMEKHGMVLSKNHAYALFCLRFPLSLLSFIDIEVLQVILLIWCLKGKMNQNCDLFYFSSILVKCV